MIPFQYTLTGKAPMGVPFITFFFVFFFCFAKFGESSDKCVRIRCSKNEPVISFPFRIKGRQNEWCGYPGFDLTCNDKNKTVLELPFSSPFYVHHINYSSNSNKIQLHDPDNCLSKRLLDSQLNLSGTPFMHIHNKNYSFYNCSSVRSINSASTAMISCLGTSGRAVFATCAANPDSLSLNQNCELIANLQVPVETSDHIAYSLLRNDIHLTWAWSTSDCKGCNYPKAPSKKHGHGFAYLLIIIGVIAIICFVCFRAWVMRNIYRGNHLPHQSGIVNTGLNESTIESFPTIVLGENRQLPKDTDTACSICIEEYQPIETLRSLPACNHYFHAHCIDVWLLRDSRCPVCNTISPVATETAP